MLTDKVEGKEENELSGKKIKEETITLQTYKKLLNENKARINIF